MLDERKLYHYWMNSLKRAKKNRPVEAWKRAEDMLLIEETEKAPYLSGYRSLYESLKSFLDQNSPQFDVQPTKAFSNDPVAVKHAEADSAMLSYIWSEQEIQKKQSRKLDSCLIRNAGFTLPQFDVKKWLPSCVYLKARNVGIDPDCDGQIENASWMSYEDSMSIEELMSKYDIPKIDLEKITKKAGSVLCKDDQDKLGTEEERKQYKTVIVYHIFARGDAAIRETEDDEIPKKSTVEELELETPKRYLQYVEGLEKPLEDGDWPYELDENEFPITTLSFNRVSGNLYSYTDNDHMARIDRFCDNLMSDIEESSRWSARKKFGGSLSANDLPRETVESWLNDPDRTFLENSLDSSGKPKIVEIQVGKFDYSHMQTYQLATEERKNASALGELMSTSASEYKDVTALAASIHDANAHQRINRRLGGPEGYEVSIAQDATKILEIAHQEIPKLSTVEMEVPDEFGELSVQLVSLPWIQAEQVINNNGKLVQLGADAIIGEELSQYWRTTKEFSPITFKLSTSIRVLPGSTREATKEKKAAIKKQFYLEILGPFLAETGRPDLASKYIKTMGFDFGIDNMDEYLPEEQQTQQMAGQNQQIQEKQMNDQMEEPGPREQLQIQQQQAQQGGEQNASI